MNWTDLKDTGTLAFKYFYICICCQAIKISRWFYEWMIIVKGKEYIIFFILGGLMGLPLDSQTGHRMNLMIGTVENTVWDCMLLVVSSIIVKK